VSAENVDVVRRAIDAYNRRDVEGFLESTTKDYVIFTAVAGAIESGGIRGPESLRRYFEMLDDTWEEFRLVIEEYRDLGDRVLGLGRTEQGQWRPGGLPVRGSGRFSRRQGMAFSGLSRPRRGVAGGGPYRLAVRCGCPV
jgi:ketosteroid isomerase-like protein